MVDKVKEIQEIEEECVIIGDLKGEAIGQSIKNPYFTDWGKPRAVKILNDPTKPHCPSGGKINTLPQTC